MSASLSLTEYDVLVATRAFLLAILPAGVEVVRGQDNRVPEPAGADFVVVTPVGRERLGTNVVTVVDVSFTGSIALATLTVTAVSFGSLGVGSPVLGTGVAPGTVVTALGTGTGGVGTYSISPSHTVTSAKLAAGTRQDAQATVAKMQVDVHGPRSADNLQVITTLFRSERGLEIFAGTGISVTPLYTSDPVQLPFVNEAQQVEERWVVDLLMQVNPTVTTPQQFADQLAVAVVSVDADYPPTL